MRTPFEKTRPQERFRRRRRPQGQNTPQGVLINPSLSAKQSARWRLPLETDRRAPQSGLFSGLSRFWRWANSC